MADVNVKMRLTADDSEAKKVVSETESNVERLKAAAERTRSAAPGGGGGGNGPPPDTKKAAREMADEFGRRAGAAIGKFVLGFMMNQGVATAFSIMRKPGEDSRRMDQAESAVSGAISIGSAGAMVAGPAGAVVGAILGGLNNFISKEKEIRDANARFRMEHDREMRSWERGRQTNRNIRFFDWAVSQYSPDRQAGMIRERESSLRGGGKSAKDIMADFHAAQSEYQSAHSAYLASSLTKGEYNTQTSGIEKEALERMEAARKRLDAYERLLGSESPVKMSDGKYAKIGGNDYWTMNAREARYLYMKEVYGDGEKTKDAKDLFENAKTKVEPLMAQYQSLFLSDMERMKSLSFRTAITDSASSKGLGVGAQIGGSANERVIQKIDRIINIMIHSPNKMAEVMNAHFKGGSVLD